MIDSLASSLRNLTVRASINKLALAKIGQRYVERLSSLPYAIIFDETLDDQPNIRQLQTLTTNHESMKR